MAVSGSFDLLLISIFVFFSSSFTWKSHDANFFVEFRCECHLSHGDRDAIRTWPSDRWRLLGSWLVWASAKRYEMTGPEGRDKWFIGGTFFHGMVPWFCGPEESWHIPMSSDICKSLS
jgi:hypothetical protein